MAGGRLNGKGVYSFANGARYEGDWEDGKSHGHGVCSCANGNRYEGAYQDDKMHGHGRYFFRVSGDVHEARAPAASEPRSLPARSA